MTTFAVTSVNSLRCQVSTCFRIGSKFRGIRSTPTEMQSTSENDFECFASTGVNTPQTMRQTLGSDAVPHTLPVHLIRFAHNSREWRQLVEVCRAVKFCCDKTRKKLRTERNTLS